MLELAILGLLKQQELHGYELKKRLAETFVPGGVSFGSLYPALSRLEAAGAVRVIEGGGEPDAIPMTGALTGELAAFRARKPARGSRGKKVYGITERGEQLFEELLAADNGTSEDERAFNLRLALARFLPREARLGLLERRRAYLLERLHRTKHAVRNGWERLDAYTRSLLEHGSETTERDISWLDRLIAGERAHAPTAPEGPAVAVSTTTFDPDEWADSTAPTMPAPTMPAPTMPAPPTPAPTTPGQPEVLSAPQPQQGGNTQ